MQTVVAVHTTTAMVEPTKELFNQYLPHVCLINIADDSLIEDVIAANGVTLDVKTRLLSCYKKAIDAGADLIFNTCSSVGDVALEAKEQLPLSIVKIDDTMALKAVSTYERIGVLATLPTTLGPTVRLLKYFAKKSNKQIKVYEGLAQGAFNAILSGDKETHDTLIIDAALAIAHKVDAFVLAQGSMARMEKHLQEITGRPVLSSPQSGVLAVKQMLETLKSIKSK